MSDDEGHDEVVRRVVGRVLGVRRSVTFLGRGTDHAAYDVDGAFVARVPLRHHDAALEREAALLRLVASVSPIPVPEVVGIDEGVLVLRRLPGTSLLDEPCRDLAAVADQMGLFLHAIWSLPREQLDGVVAVDDHPLLEHLAEASATYPVVAPLLDDEQRGLVERFLAAAPPAEASSRVLCHNDLGAEHLLAAPDRVTITGVIDWSDAAITDPARDLGRLARDLGPAVLPRLLSQLPVGDPGAGERAMFHARCALLEDLEHGLLDQHRRYRAAALAALPSTFGL